MTETKELRPDNGPKTGLERDSAHIQTRTGPKTETYTNQHNTAISHINPKTYMGNMERIIGICDVCSRSSGVVGLRQYEFGQQKELVRIEGTKVVICPDPLYFSIIICSSCTHLLRKLKKENTRLKPKQLYLVVKSYREQFPIQSKK